jgi:hypothetical protein
VIGAHGDLLATGRPPGELDRGGAGSRSVLGELHHLRTGHDPQDLLGTLEFERGRTGEVGTRGEGGRDRVHHRRVCVAQRHRAQAHAVLDVLVAVRVPHVATEPALEDGGRQLRVLVGTLRVRVCATRHQGRQPIAQTTRLLVGAPSFAVRVRRTRRTRGQLRLRGHLQLPTSVLSRCFAV